MMHYNIWEPFYPQLIDFRFIKISLLVSSFVEYSTPQRTSRRRLEGDAVQAAHNLQCTAQSEMVPDVPLLSPTALLTLLHLQPVYRCALSANNALLFLSHLWLRPASIWLILLSRAVYLLVTPVSFRRSSRWSSKYWVVHSVQAPF